MNERTCLLFKSLFLFPALITTVTGCYRVQYFGDLKARTKRSLLHTYTPNYRVPDISLSSGETAELRITTQWYPDMLIIPKSEWHTFDYYLEDNLDRVAFTLRFLNDENEIFFSKSFSLATAPRYIHEDRWNPSIVFRLLSEEELTALPKTDSYKIEIDIEKSSRTGNIHGDLINDGNGHFGYQFSKIQTSN